MRQKINDSLWFLLAGLQEGMSQWGREFMVKGRGSFREQEHFPSFVFCGVGAVTVLPTAPRASDKPDTAPTIRS